MDSGFIIKKIREFLGLSQREFAFLLDYTQANISGVETGKLPLSDSFIEKLMDKIPELNISYVRQGIGPMFNKSETESMIVRCRNYIAKGGVRVSGYSNHTTVSMVATEKDLEYLKKDSELESLRKEVEMLKALLESRDELLKSREELIDQLKKMNS